MTPEATVVVLAQLEMYTFFVLMKKLMPFNKWFLGDRKMWFLTSTEKNYYAVFVV